MGEKLKPGDIARFTTFAAAMATATGRVNEFSARLATLSNVSEIAALQLAQLSSSAAQMLAPGQRLATCCQCTCAAPSDKSSDSSSYLDRVQRVFVPAATFLATVVGLLEAVRWLRATGVPLAISGLDAMARVIAPIWQAIAESEAVIAVTETLGELFAAVAAVVTGLSIATIATGAVLLAGAYLVWRYWSAIVRAIRGLGAAVAREATSIMSKLASVLMGEPEGSSDEDLGPTGDAAMRRHTRGRLYSIAPSMLDSVSASSRPVSSRGFMALSQPPWNGFQQGPLTVRKAAAIAMLSVPMLAAPAMATLSSGQPRPDTAGSAAIVINSTPTIVINACQPDDIEHRVLEVLRQHREAIYTQLFRQLQRRQRTEF